MRNEFSKGGIVRQEPAWHELSPCGPVKEFPQGELAYVVLARHLPLRKELVDHFFPLGETASGRAHGVVSVGGA